MRLLSTFANEKVSQKIFVCLSVHLHASARISKAKIGVKHCDTHTLPLYVCSAPICLKIFNLVCLSMRLPEGTFLWQALWPLAVHTGSQNVGQVPKYFYIWFDNVVIRTFMLYSRYINDSPSPQKTHKHFRVEPALTMDAVALLTAQSTC